MCVCVCVGGLFCVCLSVCARLYVCVRVFLDYSTILYITLGSSTLLLSPKLAERIFEFHSRNTLPGCY